MRRFASCAVVVGLAGLAHADFMQVQAEGTFDLIDDQPDQLTVAFDAAAFDQGGGFGFTSAEGEATQVFGMGDTDDFTGSGQLIGATGADVLDYAFEAVLFPGDNDNATFAGTWEVTGASGDYEGLVGSGQLSGFYLFEAEDTGQFGIVFQGDLVPAPGAAALIGLGALAATRRRR